MKLKSNVDLAAAFDLLKQGLKAADAVEKNSTSDYVVPYCMLAGFVSGAIKMVEHTEEPEKQPEDDLPGGVFTGPGTSD